MTIFEVLFKEIDGEIRRIQENLGTGRMKDYAEYRFSCGAIQALHGIRAYIDGLKQNLEGEE